MNTMANYWDSRSELWKTAFAAALPYAQYLATDPPKAERWVTMGRQIPPLTADEKARLQGHERIMNVLVSSGIWCGDCVRQGPMLEQIAKACGPKTTLRWIDRDADERVKNELRVVGAERVPMILFLTEDFWELGRFGDRLLSVYRAKARRELGAACSTGLFAPPDDELRAEQAEWIDIFERMLLMARLSPPLRARHGD